MKKTTIILIFILSSLTSFAQIIFEKGYFINNENKKVECYIKNIQWYNNPTVFDYKISDTDTIKTRGIENTCEFGIYGYSKYFRANAKLDTSSMNAEKLSDSRLPQWSNKVVFLKVLVEGQAVLYSYSGNQLIRFFFSTNDSVIKPLVFKEYYNNKEKSYNMLGSIVENGEFRQQLYNELRCGDTSPSDYARIHYSTKELIKYFNKYNSCKGGVNNIEYGAKEKGNRLNIKLAPGVNFGVITLSSIYSGETIFDFKQNLSYHIGVEFEYIMPFNKNKWGLVAEPSYQTYKGEDSNTLTGKIDYQAIQIALGIRHYVYLSENAKLFANGFYNTSLFNLNSKLEFGKGPSYIDVQPDFNFLIGGGFEYKRVSAEMRYYSNRQLFNHSDWNTDYNFISLIVGYKILNSKLKN